MQKLHLLCVALWLTFSSVSAQNLQISGTYLAITEVTGLNAVYLFANLSNVEIRYTGSQTPVQWFSFEGDLVASGVTELYPDNATGYYLKAGTDSIAFWVLDYSQYLPQTAAFYIDEQNANGCEETILKWEGVFPALNYKTTFGQMRTLPREQTISYTTLAWQGEGWQETDVTEVLTGNQQQFSVTPPLCNTHFVWSADQYAAPLGLSPTTVQTSLHRATAVKCNPTTVVTIRSATNELERPSSEEVVSGSAPLDILFRANANTPTAQYYQWQILKEGQLLVVRNTEEHRYTFNEAGVYTAKLVVSNMAECTDSAEVQITVSESSLQIPNVFTPNGDGFNDEFRVAYKSLVEFQGYIFNRWGKTIFEWTDPAKGWDGTIGGKKAPAGAYFFLITAKGSDGIRYKRKGDINLLR